MVKLELLLILSAILVFVLIACFVIYNFIKKLINYDYEKAKTGTKLIKYSLNIKTNKIIKKEEPEKAVTKSVTKEIKIEPKRSKKTISRRNKQIIKIIAKTFVYVMLALMYLPIIVLIIFSFTEATLIGHWDGFSFGLYKDLFNDEEVMSAFVNTLIVAITSGIVSTILGTLGAIGIFYSSKKMRKTFEVVGQVPILNPEIVTALSLTVLFVLVGIQFNYFTLLVGHIVLTIPFVVLSITPKLKQLDPNSYEAALDLGAKPAKAMRKVILPEILPGILSGFLLAVTLSLDDYIITAFTKDPSFVTLSTYVYGITAKKGALPPMLRSLTTIIFIITLGVLLLVNIYSAKQNKKGGKK